MRNHTAKPFEAKSTDHICVGFQGKNRIFVKDNHGTITKVNRKDVTPIEMDIKIAELFKESRQKLQNQRCTTCYANQQKFQILAGNSTKISN